MRSLPVRIIGFLVVWALVTGSFGPSVAATQNPITAARDAIRKVQEELKRKQEEEKRKQQGQQPQAGTVPNEGRPAAPQNAPSQGTSSQPVTLDDLASADPAAPITPPNAKMMPDVIGIHLGMSLDEVTAVLKRDYPKNQLVVHAVPPGSGMLPPSDKPIVGGLSINKLRVDSNTPYGDQIILHVTHPPNPQVVFSVSRLAQRQHVNRGTLLAALREKYGKEAFANANGGTPARDERQIMDLWWLLDEQGRSVPAPGNGMAALNLCADLLPPPEGGFLMAERHGWTPWCESSHIALMVRIDPNVDIIESIYADMVHLPLGLRAARATIAWRDAVFKKLRQEEIERTKQVKPKL